DPECVACRVQWKVGRRRRRSVLSESRRSGVKTMTKYRELQYPFTLSAIVFAVMVLLAAMIWDINLIELPFAVLRRIEHHEIDDIITAFLLAIVGFVV